jgi:hypothetical protein
LEYQYQSINLLQKEKLSLKVLLASDIAAEINATVASVTNAIHLFTVCGYPIMNK